MIDRNTVALAMQQMTPESQQAARDEAKRRGVDATDVVMERCLERIGEQLDEVRRQRHRPRAQLRVV
ncbi:hypothetical protein [uncultured Halomonas sp.]|uniref:hypothetical protein n=1 Tax=uncultured Halomonas sp. TaxID=173971 RepID=UPI002625D2C3|nr:hypothetical protein [uncultured Halomonas sp.]